MAEAEKEGRKAAAKERRAARWGEEVDGEDDRGGKRAKTGGDGKWRVR